MYGRAAFIGGAEMAALGTTFSLLDCYFLGSIIFLTYPILCRISKNKIINGIAYGILIWLVMNLVVLPFTNTPKGEFNLVPAITGVSILILFVGLPISF
ncbi:MAG: hypothetical protein IPJ74_08730 [Saprospiraceae bacterium]|nr:hypothetical protein [Saprospiraceae bacterium]